MSKRTERVLRNSKPPAPFSIWRWMLDEWWLTGLLVMVTLIILGLLAAKWIGG